MHGLQKKMLRLRCVSLFLLIFFVQPIWAEENDEEELDEEFLEILGSFEAEEDDWYDFFWSTIDETEEEGTLELENE